MFASAAPLDEIETMVDRLNGGVVSELSPDEVAQAVQQLRRVAVKLAAFDATLSRRFEVDGEWAKVGALNPQAWVARKTRTPSAKCTRSFTLGRKMVELPGIQLAMEAGAIQLQHRDKILAVDNPRVHDAFVADHVRMVRWAMDLSWDDFCDELARWLEEHDQDGIDPGVANRDFDLQENFDGTYTPVGSLDAISGQIARNELDRLDRQLFEEDWAEAKERLGCDPIAGDLRRTHAQRRADAFRLMAERSATLPEDGRRGTHLFTVLVGAETFAKVCRLASGQSVRPTQLAPYLNDDAVVQTIVYDTKQHAISASSQNRFTGLLKWAILAKTRRCTHDWCDTPTSKLVVDHRKPVSKGGPTTQENGQGMCDPHNARKGATDATTDLVDDP